MAPLIRMRSPLVSLQRQRRSQEKSPSISCRKQPPSLTLIFVTIALATFGFLVLTEVIVMQKKAVTFPRRFLGKESQDRRWLTHSRPSIPPPPVILKGDEFRIEPLLRRNSFSVELSAQMQLNSLTAERIRQDVIRYHQIIKIKSESRNGSDFYLELSSEKYWNLPLCPIYPPFLSPPREIDPKENIPLSRIPKTVAAGIQMGGLWRPDSCLSQHAVAVVIPYRDRWLHLTTLMNHLHPLLQRQFLQYQIFVVEQQGNETFNKGILMNAAFIEALQTDFFHCFIFHDVDLLPENEYNMYTCPQMPRHLSVAVNELHYKLPYDILVGGVLAIRTEHFFKVNGYSNLFWGWGGEDDDMGMRIQQAGLQITRPVPKIGRYTMIKHVKRKRIERKVRSKLVRTAKRRYRLDGLNTLKYRLIERKGTKYFTSLLIDVGDPPDVLRTR